ncbi:type II toxin-antitoxin system PemK/MazF family toxin [Candidatus Woesearchaeota archaeon]|nr:type II toxin-antitoxin system PemK/MazF family toxin [Candidatus Woesearchaeota archaeon]
MLEAGDIVLAQLQFTDTFEIKKRPALVLFEEWGNIVVAGITSNPSMEGVPLTTSEGAMKDCVIKLNYFFTISKNMVIRRLFSLTLEKKRTVLTQLTKKLSALKGP